MNELIEALKEQTKSNVLLYKAMLEHTDVIAQLANSVAMLVDTYYPPEPERVDDDEQPVGTYLMDGTRIS